MELIIFIVIISLIAGFIGKIGDYFSEKKSKKRYEYLKNKKEEKDSYLKRKRRINEIKTPNTIDKLYPLIGYPKNDEIYNYSTELYFIKPEYSKKELFEFEVIKGAIENHFFTYLTRYFNQELITNNKYRIQIGSSYYVPDYAYMDIENKVLIDIEIDEPYTFRQKQIIHTLGSDNLRDKYFQRAGWAVIRFSEKQIAEQPKSCCKFIAQYLAYVHLNNSYLSDFNEIPELRNDKMWSYKEAEYYASIDYRNRYLN